MKKIVVAVMLTLGLAACGTTSVTPQAQKIIPVVEKCLTSHSKAMPDWAKNVLHCVAPPGHEAAFEKCAFKYLTVSNLTIHRKRLFNGLAVCLENNR